MTMPDERIAAPVAVEITNWAPPIKPPLIKSTTLRTFIVDPAATVNNRALQIASFEPKRIRMAVFVIDAAVAMLTEPPTNSPDVSTASAAPQGAYLPPNISGPGYEFFGPDNFWINPVSTVTRVTVIKEYRE